jgi:hypothetical protein
MRRGARHRPRSRADLDLARPAEHRPALAAEQRVIHIADLRSARMLSPRARKRVMDHMQLGVAPDTHLATVVVVDNAALAALVRTVMWMGGRRPELMIFDSIDEAIERSLLCLRDARIPPPIGLAPGCYQSPRPELRQN